MTPKYVWGESASAGRSENGSSPYSPAEPCATSHATAASKRARIAGMSWWSARRIVIGKVSWFVMATDVYAFDGSRRVYTPDGANAFLLLLDGSTKRAGLYFPHSSMTRKRG